MQVTFVHWHNAQSNTFSIAKYIPSPFLYRLYVQDLMSNNIITSLPISMQLLCYSCVFLCYGHQLSETNKMIMVIIINIYFHL
jgi:hypothetical protein